MEASRRGPVVDERGIYLPFTAAIVLALATIVALAIDTGAAYARAADQQRAADLAALAGVQALVEHGSELDARDRVHDVLASSSIDLTDRDITVTVRAVTANELAVEIEDASVDLSFGSLLIERFGITRRAVATLANCGAGCDRDLVFAPPVGAIDAPSEGDGWTPTLVGDRIFSLNHHQPHGRNSLICVERSTREFCAGYPTNPGTFTNDVSALAHDPVTNTLWFTKQTTDRFGVECWSPATDRSCGITWLATKGVLRSNNERNTRGSHPVAVGGRIYTIEDSGLMHCVNPSDGSVCAGYPRATSFLGGGNGMPADVLVGNFDQFFAPAVVVIDEFVVSSTVAVGHGVYVQCFDTGSARPCRGWGDPVRAELLGEPGFGADSEVYIHVHAGVDARPDGVCAQDAGALQCWTLDARSLDDAGLDAALASTVRPRASLHVGERSYFTDQRSERTTCWEWTSRSSCGERIWSSDLDPNQTRNRAPNPYGYAWTGECLIGLGDTGYFWSFDRDLRDCGADGAESRLYPCACADGRTAWGVLRLDLDELADLGGRPELSFFDPAGNLVFGPIDLRAVGGEIDLAGLPGWPPHVTVVLDADLDPGQQLSGSVVLIPRPTLIE